MNATAPRPRPLARLFSVAAVCSLAIVGLSTPTIASAAVQTVDVDTEDFSHLVVVTSGTSQLVTRGSTTVTVTLPDITSGIALDSGIWITEDGEQEGTFTLSGTTATLTIATAFWASHPVNSVFDITLIASDDLTSEELVGDAIVASYTIKATGTAGATALTSDGATIDSQTSYRPLDEPLTVATDDTVVLDGGAGFWTTGPFADSDLSETFTTEESVEISEDGSTATVTIGVPSRYLEATSPDGTQELGVTAYSLGDTVSEYVDVTVPYVHSKPTPVIDRVAGQDRYEGAAAISAAAYPDGSDVVYVAAGTAFPDALSAAPAAAHEGGPLLLTLPDRVPASISAEIKRLQPERIVVVGGTAAVSNSVFNALDKLAPTVDRIAGADRFEVSRKVARYAFEGSGSEVAFFASGAAFPDALSASSAAGSFGAPVILVRGNASGLDNATVKTIQALDVQYPIIAGGRVSVSGGIEAQLDDYSFTGAAERLAGADRYLTSLAIARFAFDSTDRVFIASGANFPDALAGAAWAGVVGAPLYIAPTSCVPDGMVADIGRYAETQITLLGGTKSLTSAVQSLKKCGFGDMPEAGWEDGLTSIDAFDGLEPIDRFDAFDDLVTAEIPDGILAD